MTSPMVPWPDKDDKYQFDPQDWDLADATYERARYKAAMQRLRICEAVLQDVRTNAHTLEDAIGYATEALATIGDLPPDDAKGGE